MLILPLLNAQETRILYSNGGEFSISSGGYRVTHKGGTEIDTMLLLQKDDVIQTGSNCFVELYLEPGKTRIKIAENTSLMCKGTGQEALSMSFSLIYGRIRISTGGIVPLIEENAVYIETGQIETAFRKGDAGIDYIVKTDGSLISRNEPVLTIYNFYGNQELKPGSWLSSIDTGLQVFEYESLSVEIANSLVYAERKPLDEDIIDYWNRNNFSDGVPLLKKRQSGLMAEQAPAVIERIEYVYPQYQTTIIEQILPDNPFHKRLFRIKNALISSGMIFSLGGIGMQMTGFHRTNGLEDKTNKLLYNFGYMPLVIGLIFSGAGLVINPQNLVVNAAD
jgi:hypothetical protein